MSYKDKKWVEHLFKSTENNKVVKGRDDKQLFDMYNQTMEKLWNYLSNLDAFEMGHAINSISHFLDDKQKTPIDSSYQRGSIILVDFGCTNFGYEFSYLHPAVVLAQSRYHVFLAPCSSKKFGKGYPDVLDAFQKDGFEENTGVILTGMRWCSKNRIIFKMSTASNSLLRKLDQFQLSKIPLNKDIDNE